MVECLFSSFVSEETQPHQAGTSAIESANATEGAEFLYASTKYRVSFYLQRSRCGIEGDEAFELLNSCSDDLLERIRSGRAGIHLSKLTVSSGLHTDYAEGL
jgi:hypothetical protein